MAKFFKSYLLNGAGMGIHALVMTNLLFTSCGKVPISAIKPSVQLGQSYWFESESTLFVFYRVTNSYPFDGLGVLETSLEGAAKENLSIWNDVTGIKSLFHHEKISCGALEFCGSFSVKLAKAPKKVRLRYRYHKDSEYATHWDLNYIQINGGFGSLGKSYFVYGTFDAANQYVRWVGQHNFPSLSHREAHDLGLRRSFSILEESFGTMPFSSPFYHPSYYNFSKNCHPMKLYNALPLHAYWGQNRWSLKAIPEESVKFSAVCGKAVVIDGNGEFVSAAIARKNPVVSHINRTLKASSHKTDLVKILMTICHGQKDDDFENFQKERLRFDGSELKICLDDTFSYDRYYFAKKIGDRLEELGNDRDFSLVIALHNMAKDDTGTIHTETESGLMLLLTAWPNIAGVFIYDSVPKLTLPQVLMLKTVWCPIVLSPDALEACRTVPSKFDLGPLKLTLSPVFPTREGFHKLKESQKAGAKIISLDIFAPNRFSELQFSLFDETRLFSYDIKDQVEVDANQALSYCPLGDPYGILGFKQEALGENEVIASLQGIGAAHRLLSKDAVYHLGLSWQFPFLIKIRYQSEVKGSIGQGDLAIPIGFKPKSSDQVGEEIWGQESFNTEKALTKCHEFCDHPVFDGGGSYVLGSSFRVAQQFSCYAPKIPLYTEGEGGN